MFKCGFGKCVSIQQASTNTCGEIINHNRLKGIHSILWKKFEKNKNPSGCKNGNEDGEHERYMTYGL